jgi:hypothetical protein
LKKKIETLDNLVQVDALPSDEKSVAINMKIFLNYLQMIGIISQFDLKWPYKVKEVVIVQSNFSALSTQIFSFDCILLRKLSEFK